MTLDWQTLDDPAQLDSIVARSYERPCAIFKHSTRCNISAMAKYRLEDDWEEMPAEAAPDMYYLDLIRYRHISQAIAERFGVHHESPQLLLIRDGECRYDASHLSISVGELRESLQYKW